MYKWLFFAFAFGLFGLQVHANGIDSLSYGVFGKVTVYHPKKAPESVVLFVSGDGGWNKGVIDMAKNIVNQGAFVVGIDIQRYFKRLKTSKAKCYYPASDFEGLSLTLQKKYKLPVYLKPILVGYSSGATLIYGILAQAPANTFKGAISLGFCPDIEMDKPLCKGSGLTSHILKPGVSFYLEANTHLSAPFIVLLGMKDQVCSYPDTKAFIEKIPMAELVTLPKVGHGFSVTRNWLPQFITAYQKILKEKDYAERISLQNKNQQVQAQVPFVTDMPITLNPSAEKENLPLAFFISGDGGWTNFDQSVCEKLAEKGVPVIGLDAQKYFWNEKQPRETAEAIGMAVKHYLQQWNRTSFVLIGYSFGASVVPFVAENISNPLRESLKGLYSFSPDETADFEIHISDMLNLGGDEKYNVISELKKILSLKPVCVFGSEEDDDSQKHFAIPGVRVEILPGSHHYDNDYNAIANIVLKDFVRSVK